MTSNGSVFICLEGSYDRVSSLIELAHKYHYRCFTYDSNYKKHCETKNVRCNLILRGRQFKKEIRKLNPGVIILRNDSYYGENYWLAKRYKTVVIEELFQLRLFEVTQKEWSLLYERSTLTDKICLPILEILGMTAIHPEIQAPAPYKIISRSFLKAIFDRFYFGMKNRLFCPGAYTNKMCISNEKNKEFYSLLGVDENKIEVTGLPIFDCIPKLISDWNNGGKSVKHDLLYISQPWTQYAGLEHYYEVLFPNLCLLAKNYSLSVKVHPREKIQDFEVLNENSGINIISHSPSFSLEDNLRLILESKYIIGTSSALIDFAILLEKPVIICHFLFPDIQTKYEYWGFKFCTNSFEGVVRAIQDCEEKNDRYYEQMKAQEKVKSEVILDGKAHERINKVIENVNLCI